MTILDKIVTVTFVTWMAHMFSAYAVVYTFYGPWVIGLAIVAAGVKEFAIDKHYETGQTFTKNLQDFAGYMSGIILAIMAHAYLR
jgi:hypothetical protein